MTIPPTSEAEWIENAVFATRPGRSKLRPRRSRVRCNRHRHGGGWKKRGERWAIIWQQRVPRFQDCSFHGIGRLFAFADDLGVNEHECQIGRFVGPIAPGMMGAALDQYVAGLE